MKFSPIIILLFLFSCSSEKKESDSPKNETPDKENEVSNKLLIEKLCFENKTEECTEEEGKYVTCRVELEIKGNEVSGTSNCVGCGGNGDGILTGFRKGDSLFLDDVFFEPDGTEYKTPTIWLLQENKLLQLETIEINGKAKIADPNNSMVIFAFDKVECK